MQLHQLPQQNLQRPVLNDIHLTLGILTGRLQTTMLNQLNTRKELLSKLEKSGIFVKPERMYEVYAQQVDQLRLKLMQGMQQRLHLAKTTVDAIYAPSAISVARTIINSTKAKTRMVA